ncbi:hypothetical protein J4E81_002331 [Alternaria sp. BMP 2799]|nr:hypothetical protein J4E81_002331 [Alternaria sp. BMP 2799]
MSLRSIFMAAAAIFATSNAHMIMKSPVPYSVDKIDNAPITASQYPCKSNLGFTVSTMNSMAVGQKQSLTFSGSAVHGGGSCQLSVTTDTEPTKDSVFKVIKSIEGGCPGIDGPEAFDFELPDSIPNGKATFAWTWFAKLSGGPEMYMNCAPIEVTGGASDKSKFDALPDMLVANIASTTCKQEVSKDLKFPNPGSNLQSGADAGNVVDPSGDCGSTGTTPSDPSEPSSPAGGQSSAPPSSPAGGEPSAAPTSANDGQYHPAPTTPAAGQPSAVPTSVAGGESSALPPNGGGVFAPGASSAASIAPPAVPTVPSTSTTLVTVTASPTAPSPVAPTVPAGTGSPAAPSMPSTPSAGGAGTCTENGSVVCNGADQFGLCNNGEVVWQAVAAGTTCVNGSITKRGYNGRIARPRWSSRRVVN